MSSTEQGAASTRTLSVVPGRYVIVRLDTDADVPSWAFDRRGGFASVTWTDRELSLILPEEAVPAAFRPTGTWSCLRIEGPFDLDEPGVLASCVGPMAAAGLSVFAVATHDTDYLLVREVDTARSALEAAGHSFDQDLEAPS